jgi:peptidoglycan/LPS O-acetylase OafA/YrhL
VALAYLRAFHPDALGAVPRHRLALRLAGALCLAPAFLLPLETTRWISVSGLSLFSLGSALLVLSVLHAAPHPATAPLRFLGRHSYSIYLWHMPVFLWVPLALESALGVRLAYDAKILVCLSAGLLVGVALSTGLEIPILRLRDRWFPRASGPDFSSMSR